MRLIDADALIPLIQEDKIEGESLDIIKALGDGLQAETLNQACDRHIKIINSLPTIEAEPKHGRWETCESGHDAICTNCHKYWIPIEDKYDFWFCPRCGADMREVDNG